VGVGHTIFSRNYNNKNNNENFNQWKHTCAGLVMESASSKMTILYGGQGFPLKIRISVNSFKRPNAKWQLAVSVHLYWLTLKSALTVAVTRFITAS
jgi:hypothetical protein